MPPDPLRGGVAVAGIAESRLGEVGPGVTPLELVAEATADALDDAGLRKDEIDGLFTASAYYGLPGVNVGEELGIRPRYSDSTNLGGASFVSHLLHAAAAIAAGLCEVALIAYASTQRSDGGKLKSVVEVNPYEQPYAPRYPVSMFALAAARHMYEYGTTLPRDRRRRRGHRHLDRAGAHAAPGAGGAARCRRGALAPRDRADARPHDDSRRGLRRAKGDGGPFVAAGAIAPGGRLPVNTNGGGLSYTHPGMLGIFLIIEAVRQLRGEAGERQQPGTEVALVHGNGGALSAQATALLGTLATI